MAQRVFASFWPAFKTCTNEGDSAFHRVCSLQLPNVGIGQQFITFTNVTMESDKYICVRETGATNSVVIIDMANPLAPQKRPITADSALMNPVSKVLALKAAVQPGPGDNLQIFNLDMKAKMKSFAMTEPVVFWKWISASKLGLVTATSVYHWDMNVRPLSPPTTCQLPPAAHAPFCCTLKMHKASFWSAVGNLSHVQASADFSCSCCGS